MSETRFFRVRALAAAVAAMASLLSLSDVGAQPMSPAPDPRAAAPGPQAPPPAGYGADSRYGPSYGPAYGPAYGPGTAPGYGPRGLRHRRHHLGHPIRPRPECELGLHGCLGRDGLYHGKF